MFNRVQDIRLTCCLFHSIGAAWLKLQSPYDFNVEEGLRMIGGLCVAGMAPVDLSDRLDLHCSMPLKSAETA